MKKLILSTAIVLAASVAMFAQEKQAATKKDKVAIENSEKRKEKQEMKSRTPEQRADAITKRMMKVTAASAEKEVKIREINLDTEKQREADRTANATNKEDLKKAHKKRNIEREAKLKEVFSADEYSKWITYKKEVKAKHKAAKEDAKKAKSDVDEEIKDAIED